MDITSYLLGKNAGGGSEINNQNKNVTITTNGSSTVSADAGYTGLGTVGITTNVQPNLETLTETITENGTTTYTPSQNKDGFSSVSITTNVSGGGSDLDWSAIGFNGTPQAIKDGYNHAVEIMNNWDSTKDSFGTTFREDRDLIIMPLIDIPNITSMTSAFYENYALTTIALLNTENVTNMIECFRGCTGLTSVPKFNTKNVTTMQRMFSNCYSLASVPLFDTSGLTGNGFFYMFSNCNALTDTSLDNILQMCINATGYTGSKTLSTLGITNTSAYPASRIQALPHYQDFINAGWTTS